MKKNNLRVLGIESSCDETAAAVVENGRVIESSVIASQVDLHAQFGGVYPELASREHVKAAYATVNEALQQAHMGLSDLDGIAVTRGPGLAGSLVVGVNLAKGLALSTDLPVIGVNHLEGHLYSAWLYQAGSKPSPEPKLPVMALLVSGGHTELIIMRDHLQYELLGGTSDDAAGEAFDKVARLRERLGPDVPIEVDGGVDEHTAGPVAAAGATRLVAGTAVFGSDDPAAAYARIEAAGRAADA